MSEDDRVPDLARLADALDALQGGRVLATSPQPEDELLAAASLTLESVQATSRLLGSRVDARRWTDADRLLARLILREVHDALVPLRWTADHVSRRLEVAHRIVVDAERFLKQDARLERLRARRMARISKLLPGPVPEPPAERHDSPSPTEDAPPAVIDRQLSALIPQGES